MYPRHQWELKSYKYPVNELLHHFVNMTSYNPEQGNKIQIQCSCKNTNCCDCKFNLTRNKTTNLGVWVGIIIPTLWSRSDRYHLGQNLSIPTTLLQISSHSIMQNLLLASETCTKNVYRINVPKTDPNPPVILICRHQQSADHDNFLAAHNTVVTWWKEDHLHPHFCDHQSTGDQLYIQQHLIRVQKLSLTKISSWRRQEHWRMYICWHHNKI